MPIRATAHRTLVQAIELSTWISTLGLEEAIEEHDVTGMNQLAREFVVGFPDGSGDLALWLDHAAGASGPTLKSLLGVADRIWTTAYEGFAVGKDVDMLLAAQTRFAPSATVSSPAALRAALVANGAIEGGRSLQDLVATSGGNGAGVDWGASSANGGVAHLHVTAVTGSPTSVDVKVQDSADGSIWADLAGAAFAPVTGPTAERLALTGTIRQHTRAVVAFVGGTTPTATLAVTLARR